MTYNKTTWTSGDTITAEKLNNAETGIKNVTDGVNELTGDIVFTITDFDEGTVTCNKTYQEIAPLVETGIPRGKVYMQTEFVGLATYITDGDNSVIFALQPEFIPNESEGYVTLSRQCFEITSTNDVTIFAQEYNLTIGA